MKGQIRSIVTALVVSGLIVLCMVRMVAPSLPPMVGRPDLQETKKFTHPAEASFRLLNSDGLVRVSTYSGTNVTGRADVRAFLRGGETAEALRRYVESLVEIRVEGDIVQITTEPAERPDGIELFVVYEVQVPTGTNVEITSNNGNVWVEAGCGKVDVKGRNTDIDIRGPKGNVIAESVNGRITVFEAPDGGQLKTVNGNVYADLIGGYLDAATANGKIVARLLGPAVVGAVLSSQNGEVELEVERECSATILARTARGSVHTKLPLDTSAGTRQRKFVQGTVGEGDSRATISVDTLNGDISIVRIDS